MLTRGRKTAAELLAACVERIDADAAQGAHSRDDLVAGRRRHSGVSGTPALDSSDHRRSIRPHPGRTRHATLAARLRTPASGRAHAPGTRSTAGGRHRRGQSGRAPPEPGRSAVALISGIVFGAVVWKGAAPVRTSQDLLAEANLEEAHLRQKAFEVAVLIDPAAPEEAPAYFSDDERQLFSEDVEIRTCGIDGYKYTANRNIGNIGNIEGWRLLYDPGDWREQIGVQLQKSGRANITGTSFEDGVDATFINAKLPGVVDELRIAFHPGEATDGISIDLVGTCRPGDYTQLTDLLFERAQGLTG